VLRRPGWGGPVLMSAAGGNADLIHRF